MSYDKAVDKMAFFECFWVILGENHGKISERFCLWGVDNSYVHNVGDSTFYSLGVKIKIANKG